MTKTMTIEQVLAHYGWTIECERPYELRHEGGSIATGLAADIVESTLCDDAIFDGVTEAVS